MSHQHDSTEPQGIAGWLRGNRGLLGFMLVFGLFHSACADWNPVPSGSMRPTILEGDVVFVDRLAYDLRLPFGTRSLYRLGEPQRGDIVTFHSPANDERLIKRLVALPGDIVELRQNRLYINGDAAQYAAQGYNAEPAPPGTTRIAEVLQESLGDRAHRMQWLASPDDSARDNFGPLRVPADQYLMLGDNRDNSADSRYFGFVPRERIIGRAVGVLVSADITGHWMPRFERFASRLE